MAKSIGVPGLGNIALSALLAVLVKAGPHESALRPRKGWPDFAGMPESSWRRGLHDLSHRELVYEKDGMICREFVFDDPDKRDGFLQVPGLICWRGFTPLERRVYLACLTWADFETGRGRAGSRLIAHRCGRAKSPVDRALRRLRGLPIHKTERCILEGKGRAWRIFTRQKGHVYGRLPYHVMERFGFDFEPPPRSVAPQPRGQNTAAEGTLHRNIGDTAPQPRGQNTAAEGTHTLSGHESIQNPDSRSSTSREVSREDEGPSGADDEADGDGPRVMPWVAPGFVASPVGRGHWLAWQDWHRTHGASFETEAESAAHFRRDRNLASHGDDDARE